MFNIFDGIASIHFAQRTARALIQFCLLTVLGFPTVASSQSPTTAPATVLDSSHDSYPVLGQVWIDTLGTATVADAQEMIRSGRPAGMTPYESSKTQLEPGQAAWVHINVHNLSGEDRWFLQAQRPTLDDIVFYCRDATGRWQAFAAGDVVPRSAWPSSGRMPLFQLKLPAGQSVTSLWIRLAHTGTPYYTPLVVMHDNTLLSIQQKESLWFGLAFGVMLTALGLALAKWLSLRDWSFGLYSIYLCLFSLFLASYLGLAQQFLWPEATHFSDALSHALPLFAMMAALWFAIETLGSVAPRWVTSMGRALLFVLLALGFTELLTIDLLRFSYSSAVMLVAIVFMMAMVTMGVLQGSKSIRLLALGFLPVAMGTLPALGRNLGWIEAGVLSQFGVIIGSAIEMPLLLYALMQRSYGRREAVARAVGLPQQDALTGLANTRTMLSALYGCMARAERFKHSYGLIYVDFINHDWFLKEHGQASADRALIVVASHLQKQTREVDCVCRLDNAQFVVVIEGPCGARQFSQLSAKIAAVVEPIGDLLPIGATPRLHLTCAYMPAAYPASSIDDCNAVLAWLVQQADKPQVGTIKPVRALGL